MCLSINEAITHTEAEEDVVCYKFLDIEESKTIDFLNSIAKFFGVSSRAVKYVTPYRKTRVEIGKTYESELVCDGSRIDIGLHSFMHAEDAIEDMYLTGGDVVVKCVIPKGSIYFIGTFGGSAAYASNCLKYVKIIKPVKKQTCA